MRTLKQLIYIYLFISIFSSAFATRAILFTGGDSDLDDNYDFYQDIIRGKELFLKPDTDTVVLLPNGHGDILKKVAKRINKETSEYQSGIDLKSDGVSDFSTLEDEVDKVKKDKKRNTIMYFTDHGATSSKGSVINSHGKKDIFVDDLDGMLSTLKKKSANVILLHDHCYSGGMLDTVFMKEKNLFGFYKRHDTDGINVRKNTCGFAASASDEPSLINESMMYFLNKIKKMPKKERSKFDLDRDGAISMREGFEYYRDEMLLSPKYGHSTPTSSLDVASHQPVTTFGVVNPTPGYQ